MKEHIRGRGYSKEKRIVFSRDNSKDVAALVALLKENDSTQGYQEITAHARKCGTEYLEAHYLPTECPLPSREQGLTSLFASLEDKLASLGYGRDTLPNLAARMIQQADTLEAAATNNDLNGAVLASFELGKLLALWKVYGLTDAAGKTGGRQSKRKKWAEYVAEQVTCWEDIPDSYNPIELEALFLEVYRDGNKLIAADIYNSDAPPKKLARSTFERRYLKKK